MSEDNDSERDDISPELAALFQQYSDALARNDAVRANATMRTVIDEVGKFAQQALEENTPFGQDLLLTSAAEEAEAAKQWTVAREIYEQQLHKAVEEEHVPQQVRWNLRLSGLGICEGDYESALASAEAAADKARAFGVPTLLDMSLSQVSAAARRLGRIKDAIAAADEGLAIIQETPLNNISRACLLIQRADALLIENEIDKAKNDLQQAWVLLNSHAGSEQLPGIQWRLGDWWRVEAKARAVYADWNRTREAWEAAIDCMQSAIGVWRVEGWQSEAAIQLCEEGLAEIAEEFAIAALNAGDESLAVSLRTR